MYRGKSTRGRINDFDMNKYEDILPTKCNVRIDEIEFNSPTKLDGKITAGLAVYVNGSQTYKLADLGYFKTKSGHYVWNKDTVTVYKMLPVHVEANVSDEIRVKIWLTQTKGIPFISRERKAIHS